MPTDAHSAYPTIISLIFKRERRKASDAQSTIVYFCLLNLNSDSNKGVLVTNRIVNMIVYSSLARAAVGFLLVQGKGDGGSWA